MTASLFTTLLSLLKSTGTLSYLSATILSISVFRLTKSDFAANLDVSTPVAFFKIIFITKLGKSTLTLMSPPKGSYV